MSTDHIEIRRKLNKITDVREFWKAIKYSMLDEDEFAVLWLKATTNKTYIEIAEQLNLTERTARRRYHDALQKIKESL